MEIKFLIASLLGIVLILSITQNINERFDKGKIVTNKKLRRLLWIKKEHEHISYPSLVFICLGYFYALLLIVCNVVCLFVCEQIAELITYIYFGVVVVTWVVEVFFIPSYGLRGS
ncbi:MAG: hypothetical protein E7362_03985 [Clostridiales bacterium]|nr:hypothetical protein [Clostridiales bacterium]